VPVQDQYDVLAAAVFPTGRPAEIFLYPRRLGTDDDSDSDIWQNRSGRLVGVSRGTQADKTRPRSVAQRLAAAAVQSHRTDDLRRRIADRRDQPLAKLPALVLIAQLALESGEPGPARAALEELQQHLAGDALLNSAELSCHVALPALERDGLSEIARALLELAVGRMSATPQSDGELCSELLVRLARRHLERGELEPARETFRKLVEFGAQASRQNHYGRWQMSADDSQWKRVAQEYLRAGNLTGALDALEHQIGAAQPGGAAEAVAPDVLSAIARLARELPAAERYDLLKAWTFPEGDRRQVRRVHDRRPPARGVSRSVGFAAIGPRQRGRSCCAGTTAG
jgi:tetratricopeptide (TPR) repeat protein